VLKSLSVIDEEEFQNGLREWRVWGREPWDSRGWEVEASFARNWWFLMDESVLESSNFWRMQRGERPLVLAELVSEASGAPVDGVRSGQKGAVLRQMAGKNAIGCHRTVNREDELGMRSPDNYSCL
jgi:hypothetical protein